MKALVCEMCGCHDLLKQDGVFICQSCGTRYSVEEAKKMMVEGNVDVSGSTVKVDESSKIDNYLAMAESAYSSSNYKEAENYCNKILEIDPTNSKAWLIKGKAVGWQSTVANTRLRETVSDLKNAITNVPNDISEDLKNEVVNELYKLCIAIGALHCESFASYPSCDKGVSLLQMLSELIISISGFSAEKALTFSEDLFKIICTNAEKALCKIMNDYSIKTQRSCKTANERTVSVISLLDVVISQSNENNTVISALKLKIIACDYKKMLWWSVGNTMYYYYTPQQKAEITNEIMSYHQKIQELDPSYVIPTPTQEKSGGCYVATCVYGSYNCPQVWTLRRYRDNTLAKTWYGRLFIRTYYAISPTIVKLFGHAEWFKRMWRGKLDRMVTDLQEKGVESTPYNDKRW